MHFHLPRPLHGWREFAGEVGIIVLGVLIALGFEQLVQGIAERRTREQTRESIRQELADDFARFSKRAEIQPCIDRRLNEVAKVLQAASSPDYKPPHWVGRPQLWEAEADRWEAANQSGRTSLFNPEEQSVVSGVYEDILPVDAQERQEQTAWAHLRALEDDPHPSSELLATLHLALQDARLQNWLIQINVNQARVAARALQLPKPLDVYAFAKGSPSVCLSMDMPRADALSRINSPWGEP
jgi:hypothetical protein